MPVHALDQNGILRITVDGDYTSEELRRVGARALDAWSAPAPVRVFLDFSGAAGLDRKPARDVHGTAAFFADRRGLVDRVAILAPGDLAYGLMRMGAALSQRDGLRTEVFRTSAEAQAWLDAPPDPDAADVG